MGKQAMTKAQAGAAGASAARGVGDPPHTAKLEPVGSPKRETILTGMLEEVGSRGYDATSVRTVLDRTGLYRQAFYDNFGDKESCYLAALEAGIARIEAILITAVASEEGWRAKLRAGLGATLDFLDREPAVGRALIVEVHAAGPEALQRRAAAMKKVTDFIDLAREEMEGPQSPPGIAAEGIVAGIHSVIHSRLSTGANDGFSKLLPEFMYFAVLPYFGADAAKAEMQAARA
jgi:AcrR family transcriptional regulator